VNITFHDGRKVNERLCIRLCLVLLVQEKNDADVLNYCPNEEENFFNKLVHQLQIDCIG